MTRKLAPLLVLLCLCRQGIGADGLYWQAISRILERRFPGQSIEYLLLDARTRGILSTRWNEPGRPAPIGSLVKPFTALAFGETHAFEYPEYSCTGLAAGCWLPSGHGRIGLARAIAGSCNAYFRMLALGMPPERVSEVMQRFGIFTAQEEASHRALIGLGDEWRMSPLAVIRAYCELVDRSADPASPEVLQGMALSATIGTGRAVGLALSGGPALAKTGTAPCVHDAKGRGDGYVIVLYPVESPRLALLLRVHGVPGAVAAAVAGQMLRAVQRNS